MLLGATVGEIKGGQKGAKWGYEVGFTRGRPLMTSE